MTLQQEIAVLQARIAAERAARDAGQASGVPQHYVDACGRLEALERELEQLRQHGLRAFARRRAA